jgi:tRNA-guanine family transglycosylase
MRFEVTQPPDVGHAGRLHTAHGIVETPASCRWSRTAVKACRRMLEELGATMLLSNAYHLAQRPGVELLQGIGGVHGLLAWNGPILTDSGGFQLFSLAALLRVDDDGVEYRSHVDGRRGRFTPENAVAVQEAMGVDVAMCLDECRLRRHRRRASRRRCGARRRAQRAAARRCPTRRSSDRRADSIRRCARAAPPRSPPSD